MEKVDKPNLDKVKEAISKLESRGIMLSEKCKQTWLNEENYKNVDDYIRTLEIIDFSEGTLRRTDMHVLKRRISNLENDERYATGTTHYESEYKKWHDYNNYNLIKKRYEKENKKYIRKRQKDYNMEKSTELLDLERSLIQADYLEKQANFSKNLTYEQYYNYLNLNKKKIALTKMIYTGWHILKC